jgi:hypothetical protein
MIRDKIKNSGPIVIDITGPEGNAFCLMGYASKFARQLNLDGSTIIAEMKNKADRKTDSIKRRWKVFR